MSDAVGEESAGTAGRLAAGLSRTAAAVRVDLRWLHRLWMGVAFSGGLHADYSVVERWDPRTTRGTIALELWAALGALVLLVAYPLYVLGLATRYYARRIDRLTATLGVAGVVVLSLLAWGLLTVATYLSPIAFEGLVAVAVAGLVATVSAALALVVTRRSGRFGTVAVGYPLGITALFLPPVVASLYSPTLAAVVFPGSQSIAIWLLDNVLSVGGLASFIRATFELEGLAYVGMWFGLAVPTGWLLGGLVALANAVRPTGTAPDVMDPDSWDRLG